MEVKVTNKGIRNAEVHGNDVVTCDEVVSNHWPKAIRPDDATSDEAVRGIPNFEFEGVTDQHLQMITKSLSGKSNSSCKTKTAQFSQNGFSDEILKLSEKAGASQYSEKNDLMVNWVAEQTK